MDDPRLRFPWFVVGAALAGIGWLALIRVAREEHRGSGSNAPDRTWLWWGLFATALGVRAYSLFCAPAFSDDVFRYVYEGRVVWYHGWTFPFAVAPANAPGIVDPALLDHAWLRINHPELSTIYPPLAQLAFVTAGGVGEVFGGGHLTALKTILILADLGTWAVCAASLRAIGRPVAETIAWGLSPLVILEVAREGHADSLSALGLSLGIYGFIVARPRLGYLGWACAALAKLNGLIAMPAAVRTTRRGVWIALVLCPLVAAPYLFSGGTAGAGLSAYASKWRAGDGVFSLLLWVSRGALGGDWSRFPSPFGDITLTQHQLARAFVVALFGLWTVFVLARPAPLSRVPQRAALLLLGLLLLAPTLHPWYVLWLLPFAAAIPSFRGRTAILLLATWVPVLHHPGWLELLDGHWRDLAWIRFAVHGSVWTALIVDFGHGRRPSIRSS